MSTSKKNEAKAKPPLPGLVAWENTIVIEIGAERKKYYVHKGLLTYHSEYFRKALDGPWKEACERVVTLRDVEPSVFNIFVHWLYTQKLPEHRDEWIRMIEPNMDLGDARILVEFKAYVFADRFLALEFRRMINNSLVYHLDCTFIWDEIGPSVVSYAFSNIPADRAILQHLVDDYCKCWILDGYWKESFGLAAQKTLPPDFILRIMRRYRELSKMDTEARYMKRCYKEHVTEQEQKDCPDQHMKYSEEDEFGYFE